MADLPTGATPGDPDEPVDPLQALLAGLGGGSGLGAGDLAGALRQLADLMSWEGGPVNWDLAGKVAAERAATDDPPLQPGQRAAVVDALRLADLWLDAVTDLPSGVTVAEAWTRSEWTATTLPLWRQLADPVAERVVGAMGSALPQDMQALAGPLLGMVSQVGGMVFGAQIGTAVGGLAAEVVGSTDVGLPLAPPGRAALLPSGVTAFGAGLGIPEDQVRLHLALREAAHARLFGHVPWLRATLLGAVDAYARGITVDTGALEQAMSEVDPADPASLQRALEGGLFEPTTTEAQQAALIRLETLLALVEGWVDEVVAAAEEGHLPAATALRETSRRRRASGGPGEQAFAALVGLELRPRRLREAAALWAAVALTSGAAARDAVWAHPDLLPGPDDLDDPLGWAQRTAAAAVGGGDVDFDAELRRLGETGQDGDAAPGSASD